MIKKILILALSAFVPIVLANSSKAADVYQTIEVVGRNYPTYIDFYPRTLHLKRGDTLHLTVQAPRSTDVRVFAPAFNLDQQIYKTHIARFDLCIANPLAPEMYFQISAVDGKKVPGYIITCDYQTPMANVASRTIDTSALQPIINYNKDYCFETKEPSGAAPVRKPVRGYW